MAFGLVTCSRHAAAVPGWCAGSGFLAPPEDLDDAHRPAAIGHGSRSVSGMISAVARLPVWPVRAEQGADLCDVGLAACAGQQAVVADAVEPVG